MLRAAVHPLDEPAAAEFRQLHRVEPVHKVDAVFSHSGDLDDKFLWREPTIRSDPRAAAQHAPGRSPHRARKSGRGPFAYCITYGERYKFYWSFGLNGKRDGTQGR